MKPTHILMLAGIILISPTLSHAQVAGTTLLGVTVTELQEVAKGWSAVGLAGCFHHQQATYAEPIARPPLK